MLSMRNLLARNVSATWFFSGWHEIKYILFQTFNIKVYLCGDISFLLTKKLHIMKLIKSFLFFALLLFSVGARGQYTSENSFMRKALVLFQKDAKGFYQPSQEVMVDRIYGVTKNYAYDKKNHNLYVLTANGNFVVTLNKDYAKIVKKNKLIPQLKTMEALALSRKYTEDLSFKMEQYNKDRRDSIYLARKKFIEDSIAYEKALAKIKEKNEKIKKDRELAYKANHNWKSVPTGRIELHCTICDKSIAKDSLHCMGIKNDSIYFVTASKGYYNTKFALAHVAHIPSKLANYEDFKYHCDVYKDSLKLNSEVLDNDFVSYIAVKWYLDNFKKAKKLAPFGYFGDWGWDNEYGYVTFNFDYTNLNSKTIKYIDVYWYVTNDVNDICGKGHFKGVGPLEVGNIGRWKWDDSSYYVSRSATTMRISKVILTYMNGTKQVLSKNMIKFGEKNPRIEDNDDGMEVDYGESKSRLKAIYDKMPIIVEPERPYNRMPEVQAKFPGGEAALLQFISRNLKYPEIAQEQELQGTVVLRFKVNVDGLVSDIKIEKSLSRECDQAAMDVVRKLPRFIPAKENGRPIPVWFRLPLRFRVQ